MAKISIEDLRKASAREDAAWHARRDAEDTRRKREEIVRQEADWGAYWILAAAIIESRVDGFPSSVSIESPNGYRKGWSIQRPPGGTWTIVPPEGGWPVADLRSHSRHQFAPHAQRAMGLRDDRATHAMVQELLTWDVAALEGEVAAVASAVPPHALAGSLALGSEFLTSLGLGRLGADGEFVALPVGQIRNVEVARAWIRAVRGAGIDLDLATTARVLPGNGPVPLRSVASRDDAAFLIH
jgi:hypothetical protein